MKQKGILWSMLAIIMVAMLSIGFVACSSDDDDDSSNGVVGTWSGQEGREYITLTFNSNGSGNWSSRYYDSYSGMETEKGSFTYKMDGQSKGVITIKEYDSYSGYDTEHMYFEINGKKMYLYEKGYGDALAFVLSKE